MGSTRCTRSPRHVHDDLTPFLSKKKMFFVCVMDVESGCGLPWRMWMECVAMCVDGCVERVCPRELCGVRFEVRGVHASGLSSMCPSVYAMLWSVLLWAWFLPLYGG